MPEVIKVRIRPDVKVWPCSVLRGSHFFKPQDTERIYKAEIGERSFGGWLIWDDVSREHYRVTNIDDCQIISIEGSAP